MRSANGLKVENQTALDNPHLPILFTAVHYIYITSAAIAMSIYSAKFLKQALAISATVLNQKQQIGSCAFYAK